MIEADWIFDDVNCQAEFPFSPRGKVQKLHLEVRELPSPDNSRQPRSIS
jgi:hypothetical protein